MTPDEILPRIEFAIRDLVKPHMRPLGIEDVVVEPGEDYEGEPVIFVQVRHRLIERPIDLLRIIALDRQLRDRAWSEGERRFLHVQHHYDEKQDVAA